MKKALVALGIGSIVFSSFVLITLCVSAQSVPSAGASADTLATAINLLSSNAPADAEKLLATIPQSDPAYAKAQCYKAFCLYAMTNYLAFLKQAESPVVSNGAASAGLSESLDAKSIKALFFYRRFQQVLSRADAFQSKYPQSSNAAAISEYKMATLFEWGMKNALDAAVVTDTNQLNQRLGVCRTNLTRFLTLAASFAGTNYNFVPNRNFKDDVLKAQIALGDDNGISGDTGAQERFNFLRIKLFNRLYKEQVDQNLALQTNYLSKFPESDDKAYVRLLAAEYSFRKGRLLSLNADTFEESGNTNTADAVRGLANRYFQQMRSLEPQIITNRAAGVEVSDVLDAKEDLLYSYFLEKDYPSLLSLASSMMAGAQRGDPDWIVAEYYTGIAFAHLPVPNDAEAAAAYDQIIALGFQNNPQRDHFVVSAVESRISLAQRAHDMDKAVQLVLWVNASTNCTKNIKADFLKDDGYIAGLPQN